VLQNDASTSLLWTEPSLSSVRSVADPSLKDTSSSLVILPSSLEGGKTYTFTLTASKGQGANAQNGYASRIVTVNTPPAGGSCSVASSIVSVLEGATIECSMWNDGQTPLKYQVRGQTWCRSSLSCLIQL
jgi:hypothetical protein